MTRFTMIAFGPVLIAGAALLVFEQNSRVDANQPAAAKKQAGKKSPKPIINAEPDKPLLANFMRAKLTASGQVLEGLCTEDFGLISKGSKNLHKVSSAEKWRVSNDASYRQYSREFRAGVERLIKAAEKKQLDAASLAWTKTTLNCIECHRWVRTMLIADNPQLKLRLPETAAFQRVSK